MRRDLKVAVPEVHPGLVTLTFPVAIPPASLPLVISVVVGGKCKKRTRANRNRKKCDLRLKGSFKHQGSAGKNSFRFRGRLRGRKLKPGRYYLVARATDAAGNRSTLKRVAFRIVRR